MILLALSLSATAQAPKKYESAEQKATRLRDDLRACKWDKIKGEYGDRDLKSCSLSGGKSAFADVQTLNSTLATDPSLAQNQNTDSALLQVVDNVLDAQIAGVEVSRSFFRRRNHIESGVDPCQGAPKEAKNVRTVKESYCLARMMTEKSYNQPSDYELYFRTAESNALMSEVLKQRMQQRAQEIDADPLPGKIDPIADPGLRKADRTRQFYMDVQVRQLNDLGGSVLLNDSPLWQRKIKEAQAGRYSVLTNSDKQQLSQDVDLKYGQQLQSLRERKTRLQAARRLWLEATGQGRVTPMHMQARAEIIAQARYLTFVSPEAMAWYLAQAQMERHQLCDFVNQWTSDLTDPSGVLEMLIAGSDQISQSTAIAGLGAAAASPVVPVLLPVAGGLGAVSTAAGGVAWAAKAGKLLRDHDRNSEFQLASALSHLGGEDVALNTAVSPVNQKSNSDVQNLALDAVKQIALLRASKWIDGVDTVYAAYSSTKAEDNDRPPYTVGQATDENRRRIVENVGGLMTYTQIEAVSPQLNWALDERKKGRSREDVASELWQRIQNTK